MERKKNIRHFRDLEFSLACRYIDQDTFDDLDDEYEQLIAMLNSMELNAEKFCY